MSSTAYAKRNTYKPIDFFYRGVCDVKTKKVAFVDAFQILNDRYLGRMNVCNYFFIAENSVRINELNLIALDELKNYHLVMRENFLIPEKLVYSLPITVRFLENEQDFSVLVSALKENGYKKGSLVLAFNTNTIIRLDAEGKKRYDRLRRMGFKTCIYGFGEEFNSLDIFAKMNFDYLRLEASYFDTAPAKKRILNMLIAYCRTNKINLIMEGVETPPQMLRFKKAGVKLMTGKAVSKLVRFVTNDFLGLPELTGSKKDAYLKKLKLDLEAEEERSHQEYEKLRLEAIEKAKAEAMAGGVMPASPRPELKKSPYQVRLELQKQAALHAAQAIINKISAEQYYKATAEEQYAEPQPEPVGPQAELYIREQEKPQKPAPVYDAEMDARLVNEAEHTFVFEGEMQGMMAVSAATDEKDRARLGNLAIPNMSVQEREKLRLEREAQRAAEQAKKEEELRLKEEARLAEEAKKAEENAANAEGGSIYDDLDDADFEIYQEPEEIEIGGESKPHKEIVPDLAKENKLYREVRGEHLGENLGGEKPFGGFGVKIKISKPDGDEYIGHYNKDGLWVDEDGFVYNGYFDEEGNWYDYEEYDPKKEGHYNFEGKYVDEDGTEYNGYFDENGRWIDFTYIGKDGKEVDNGYFSEELGKWIPYGYFDEMNIWKPYD